MTINVSLPPDLEQFVREQMATSRFISEADIIIAAVQLLQSHQKQEMLDAVLSATGMKTVLARPSPHGIMADISSDLGDEDIQTARQEMWGNFPRENR